MFIITTTAFLKIFFVLGPLKWRHSRGLNIEKGHYDDVENIFSVPVKDAGLTIFRKSLAIVFVFWRFTWWLPCSPRSLFYKLKTCFERPIEQTRQCAPKEIHQEDGEGFYCHRKLYSLLKISFLTKEKYSSPLRNNQAFRIHVRKHLFAILMYLLRF